MFLVLYAPTIAIASLVCLLALALYAQSPAFEVVAIRQHTEGPFYTMVGPALKNGHLTGVMVTPRRMLQVAFGVTNPRVIGPAWLDRDKFDIAGESPKGVPDSQFRTMLQAFLKERFKLVTHMETRVMPVYFMVVEKGGVKMAKYPAPDGALAHPNDDPNVHGFPMARGTSTATQIAELFSNGIVDRPVIDKTGLKDRYNWFLSFRPISPDSADSIPDFGPPELFTAIKKQMGLRLDSGKDNVEVVVVDQMEQFPTEN